MIVPTPLLITFTLTSSTSILERAFLTASSVPLTSVLSITFISFIPDCILLNKSSNDILPADLLLASLACSFLFSAIVLASFSVSKAINLSPDAGTSFNPVISTGVDGRASTTSTPKSFFSVLTLPNVVPTTIGSPSLSVPFWTSKVTVEPTFLSSLDSITVPIAYLLGFAFNSLISETNWILSSNSSIPSPVSAEILLYITLPPQASGVNPCAAISFITFSGFAPGLSILFIATIIGTPAALAWSIASSVWGITPSSAATIIITISVTAAPLALISVKASCPGVSIKVIFLPFFSIWYAPICCVIPPNSLVVIWLLRM